MNVKFLSLVATALLVFAAAPGFAQEPDFPTRPINLIVPFAPGGPADIVARVIADEMSRKLQQPVIVENRSGAGGAIGAEAISKAAPDGYTIGLASVSTHVINPSCNPNLKYDPIKSFTPIGQVADMPVVLVGHPGLADNFDAFRAAARKATDAHSYGTPGPCSLGHVTLEHINHELGGQMIHVPYRGSAPAANDLLAGVLDFMSDTTALLGPQVKAGRMKALAVVWPTRLPNMKNVPTFKELGYPSVNLTVWYGLVGPAGLPRGVLEKYQDAVAQSMADPALQARFKKLDIVAVQNSTPAVFGDFLAAKFKAEAAFIGSRKMGNE